MSGNKVLFIIVGIVVFVISYIFFINKSYSLALEAKIFYMQDDFENSLNVSMQSLEIDKYNRMATSIKTRSMVSLKYIKYLKDVKEYTKRINSFDGTYKSMLKIKMISDIMVQEYARLDKSVQISQDLQKKAEVANGYFVSILKDEK